MRAQLRAPLMKLSEVVFLVWGVDAVVIQREAHKQRVHAERGAEQFDDRDRRAAAGDHRLLPPFGFERARGGAEGGRLRVETDGWRSAFA